MSAPENEAAWKTAALVRGEVLVILRATLKNQPPRRWITKCVEMIDRAMPQDAP